VQNVRRSYGEWQPVRAGLRTSKKAGASEFFGSFVNTLDTETLDQLFTMSDGGFSGVKRRIYHYPDDLKFLRLVIVTGNFNRTGPSFVRLISIDRRCDRRAIIEEQPTSKALSV
jgi:hypothetical protein